MSPGDAVLTLDAVRATVTSAALSLRLRAGERLALLGPNGAGKSSLLRVIAGLRPPVAGRAHAATPVGYCAQDYRASLFPWLSARDNVALTAPRPDDDAVRVAAARVGLSASLLDRPPETLSGGEQQRVALARAIVTRAPLVLLDEPFSALDPAARAVVRAQLRAALDARDAALVLVTHDLDDALALAARWVVLGGPSGGVRYDGPATADPDALGRPVAEGS